MWTDTTVPRYVVLSALIGLAAFCLSYAVLVWQRRNRHMRSAHKVDRSRRLRGWSFSFLLVGLLLMAVAYAVRDVVAVSGALRGDGLFAVRALDDARPIFVADKGSMEEGQILARYASQDVRTRRDELQARLDRLAAERDALPLQPLTPDAELVRRQQNAIVAARERQTTLDGLIGPSTTSERELADQILPKQQALSRTQNDLNITRKEIEQAQVRLLTAIRQRDRERDLARLKFATAVELEDRSKEVGTLEVEVARLRKRLVILEGEEKQIVDAIGNWEKLVSRQTAELGGEIDRLRAQIKLANEEAGALESVLKKDLERAARMRQRESEQIVLKIKETAATLAGAREKEEVRAPHAGWLVYRNPSPAAARGKETLAVLSPQAELRLIARLPASQREALQEAGAITLEIGEGHVLRRFAGKFRSAAALPAEPDTVLAELDCLPPDEVIALLVDGEKINARFAWQPPLETLWPFQIGRGFALFGLLGLLLSSLFVVRAPVANASRRLDVRENNTAPVESAPNSFIDTGSAGEIVEAVAVRLRESIRQREISEELVASAEWALDRHHLRAILIFRRVLRQDRDYLGSLDAHPFQSGLGADERERRRDLMNRVHRILEAAGVVCPSSPTLSLVASAA